jgi:hypothetical protein
VYNCFLTIICNISPYCKKLNMVSSVRLLRLFKLFAQPRYLFDNEANHHLVFFLLETFDNIIQYQYEGNQQVVYAMIQNKNVFYQLNDLQLPPIRASSEGKKPAKKEGEEAPEPEKAEFVPTVEWLSAWKKKLPLNTSLRLLQYLIPQLEVLPAHHHHGRPAAGAAPHRDPEVPDQPVHAPVVHHVHVGRHLPAQPGAASLRRRRHHSVHHQRPISRYMRSHASVVHDRSGQRSES